MANYFPKGNVLIVKNPHTRNIGIAFREILQRLFRIADEPAYIRMVLAVITIAGVVLRLYIINRPIGYDEAYTFINFSSKPFKFILADYHAPNNHILNSLLIGIVYRILGSHTWIVRVPAFLASSLGIPAAYLAARRFFTSSQALGVAAIIAVAPNFVSEAANGRGYPLVFLFSLLLANFAGILVKEQDKTTLAAYAVTGALGFYSIPIFLYPMAGISLWVAVTHLISNETWQTKRDRLRAFLATCLISGALTFILYSPVIFFGTGFKSLVANDIVKSQTWDEFKVNLMVRSVLTWQDWIISKSPTLTYLGVGSFLTSLLFYRKVSNQKVPMQVFLVIGAGIMIFLQRVAPLARIWGYLEMFFLFYAVTGLIWFIHILFSAFFRERATQTILSSLVLCAAVFIFINVTIKTQNRAARLDRTIAPEKLAAEYIAAHITEQDTIIAPSPIDLETAYYLKILGVPYNVFYQRGNPTKIDHALVVIRSESVGKIKSLDRLIDVFKLESVLNVEASEVVFTYGPLQVISIPAY